MPILITGAIKGTYHENKGMDVKELIETFKLKEILDALPDRVTFKLPEKKIKGDKHPSSTSIMCNFQSQFEGNSITMRYYKTSFVKSKDEVDYTPRKVLISGVSITYDKKKDLDLVVFMLLHPQCKDSPLYDMGKAAKFTLHQPKKEAKTYMEFATLQINFYSTIKELSVESLRVRAYSLNIGVKAQQNKDEISTSILRAYENAMRKGENTARKFIQDFNNATSNTKGLVMEAIATGLMEKGFEHSTGRSLWKWSANVPDKKGQTIMVVPKDHRPEDALIEHASANQDTFVPALRAYLKQENAPAAAQTETKNDAPKKIGDMSTLELVELGVSSDVLYFDRATKIVSLLKDGEPETKVCDIKDVKNWKQDVVDYLEKDAESAKKLRQKLQGKAIHNR